MELWLRIYIYIIIPTNIQSISIAIYATNQLLWTCIVLNSNLQAKTKNISQQESDDIKSLINLIISNTKGQNNGIFNICGSWKNHTKGYSAIVQKIVYDQSSIKISGIIFSLDGNGWNFTSHITNDETITKIFFFAMQ